MSRTCSICSHQNRPEIEGALLAGESFRGVSKRFGTSPTALFRHKTDHLQRPVTLRTTEQLPEKDVAPQPSSASPLSRAEPSRYAFPRRLLNRNPVSADRIMPVNG